MLEMRGVMPGVLNRVAAMLPGLFATTYWSNCGVSRVTERTGTVFFRRIPSYEKKKKSRFLIIGPPKLPA